MATSVPRPLTAGAPPAGPPRGSSSAGANWWGRGRGNFTEPLRSWSSWTELMYECHRAEQVLCISIRGVRITRHVMINSTWRLPHSGMHLGACGLTDPVHRAHTRRTFVTSHTSSHLNYGGGGAERTRLGVLGATLSKGYSL